MPNPPKIPIPLGADVFARVTLDGSGNGQASIGPTRVREHWQVESVSVSATSAVLESQAVLYVGSNAQASQFTSQTATGSSGDTCPLNNMDIQSGTRIIVKWLGGDAGAVATLVVKGTYTIGSPSGI
jgi:hypothetical protein